METDTAGELSAITQLVIRIGAILLIGAVAAFSIFAAFWRAFQGI